MQYVFTHFNGNDSMTEMTLNDIEYTNLFLSHISLLREWHIRKVDQAGIHKILPFLPGPIKLEFIHGLVLLHFLQGRPDTPW